MDLGSGSGKALLAVSLLSKFEKMYGIEVISGLFEISMQLYEEYTQHFEYIVKKHPGCKL